MVMYLSIAKKILPFLSLPFFLGNPSYSEIVDINDSENLVEIIIQEASKTFGKRVGAKKVRWEWCDEPPSYYPARNFICLSNKDKGLSLAFTAAHEYAHHIQHSVDSLADRSKKNITKVELQADCYAGIMLATNPKYPFTIEDANEMLAIAEEYGDYAYDHEDHHGSGENRMLALRSGFHFGRSKGTHKDAYYKIFCVGDTDK